MLQVQYDYADALQDIVWHSNNALSYKQHLTAFTLMYILWNIAVVTVLTVAWTVSHFYIQRHLHIFMPTPNQVALCAIRQIVNFSKHLLLQQTVTLVVWEVWEKWPIGALKLDDLMVANVNQGERQIKREREHTIVDE